MTVKFKAVKAIFHSSISMMILFFSCHAISASLDPTIATTLKKSINDYNIPGASLSIIYPDGTSKTYVAGFSDIAKKTVIKPSQLFLVGSVTKSYVSVLMLRIVDEKRVSLDDTLDYISKNNTRDGGKLKKIVAQYPPLQEVTIRECMQHNSGIRDAINSPAYQAAQSKDPSKVWSDSELIELAMMGKPFFKPGTPNAYSYTNTDYILVGMAIEAITGSSVSSQLVDLFQQNKLDHTYYIADGIIPSSLTPEIAHGYVPYISGDDSDDESHKVVSLSSGESMQFIDITRKYSLSGPSAGGIVATSMDVARWYEKLFFNQTVLPPQTLQLMLTGIRTANPNSIAGLGIGIEHNKTLGEIIGHTGILPGYTTSAMYLEKYHLVIVLTTNSYNRSVLRYDPQTGIAQKNMFDVLLPVIINSIATVKR